MRQLEFKMDFVFCDEEASPRVETNKVAKFWREIYEVKTIEMRDRVIARALERGDEWGDAVLARAQSVTDLVAAEAKCYKQCNVRYFFCKITDEKVRRCPENAEKQSAFESLCLLL